MDREALGKKIVPWFEWFHRHPELQNREYETTKRIREILAEHGIEILDTGLETGLIARVGSGRPVVALRADIDALPLAEETGLSYASEIPGCMHACGHDFHTAALLGAAALLGGKRERPAGTVKLIFQPAEESGRGSLKIIETGELEDVEEIYGLHVSPELPRGQIGASAGATYAAVGRFSVRIRGQGGHAGYPHRSRDPIVALAHIVAAAQAVVSRAANPFDPSVLSITRVEAGSTWNVIPGEAIIEGTIRSLDSGKWEAIARRLGEIVKGAELSWNVAAEYRADLLSPPVSNDGALAAFAAETARDTGLAAGPSIPGMWGEDFALYQERTRGVLLNIGTGGPAGVHSPVFAADPGLLAPAAEYLSCLAEKALARLAKQGVRDSPPGPGASSP